MAFSCGDAYALPQDWPCKVFELERNGEQISNIPFSDRVYGTLLGKTPFKSSHGPKMRTRALLVFLFYFNS